MLPVMGLRPRVVWACLASAILVAGCTGLVAPSAETDRTAVFVGTGDIG